MAWRTIHLSRGATLRLKQKQLHIAPKEQEACTVALEDVNAIIIDTAEVVLTSALLAQLGLAQVVVLVSGGDHTPATIIHSYLGHSRQTGVARRQLGMSKPLKKQLWQRVISQKIKNQNAVLVALGKGPVLDNYLRRIKSDDRDNREAVAARVYWSHLFEGFKRGDEGDSRNGALNYGYAVVRSLVVRSICAGGLLPLWGIHHDSELNEYNLADDLFEPFRPFVDYAVAVKGLGQGEGLTTEDKRQLVGLLTEQVQVQGLHYDLPEACQKVVHSFKQCLKDKDSRGLALPEWVPC